MPERPKEEKGLRTGATVTVVILVDAKND